ncbi:alpha/beta hydrolase [Flavobacterium akiainvivens]|uniref:Alpha/beta hydrolase n=1 Tax=Flavobacterium akiainvivens TaxID=1202724 RepID=A0A0M8MCR9_9FLAO|nr:alpha/beta fold hydrolase [Flavobacterium akiainvivens]KOS07455.1 alpha/beta hydrolase [Flavobacterium akiainvivens]SFQ63098.1 Pimeloyl-ACP methyl ester carboxylesterase [Flavobacterium akiainvivens]
MIHSRVEGEGKPLVVIHGFMGMGDNWKTLGGQYAKAGFEVHTLDMRNHGKSFHSDEFTYEAMVEDVAEYIAANNLGKVDLIGHSMGGKVGMFFAVLHPELLDKLVVADIAPRHYAPHHQRELEALNAVDFSVKPNRAEVESVMAQYITEPGTIQFLTKNLYWVEPGQLGFRFNLKVFNEQIENIGEALPQGSVFSGPTLFLKGDRSKYIQDSDLADISAHFPDHEIKTISNSGHWVHAENPREFFDYTIDFLK